MGEIDTVARKRKVTDSQDDGFVGAQRMRGPQRAHRRSLGFPGFPVESCGFGQLHVVLFKENHICGRG
jgi:hypothetical protein